MRNDYVIKNNVVEISLGKELVAITNLESLRKLKSLNVKWYSHFDYNKYYVYASVNQSTVKMHRFLTDAPDGLVVDHINGNSLDNRLDNLRICNQVINGHNRNSLNINNSSGARGVSFHKASGKWRAHIRFKRKQIHLGLFAEKPEAESAVISYRKKLLNAEVIEDGR
ncbi:HNH endonuclease [Bacillus thuringiensis]|uniref:HNH endonuclease n=1 Tax=Bacillus thuringiensis TaxID=1428 RepID=UPI001417037D|nr:HNH endonuclease [Bacillus thuringiensis]